jgi:hypothetical protein
MTMRHATDQFPPLGTRGKQWDTTVMWLNDVVIDDY